MGAEITSAENGSLKGTLTSYGRGCAGTFPADGTYEGNSVKFKMTEGSKGAGCDRLSFEGVAEGTKLVGKLVFQGAPRDISFSK